MALDFSSRGVLAGPVAAPASGVALDFSARGAAPLYYQTEHGKAVLKTDGSGEPWLEGDSFGGPLASFKTVTPIFSDGPASKSKSQATAKPTERSLGERFSSTYTDQANRNPLIAGVTTAMPKGDYTLPGSDAVFRSAGQQAVDSERARRVAYEAQAGSDQWYKANGGLLHKGLAGAATLAGGLAGGLSDPINLAAGAAGGGRTLVARIARDAGINAALDLPTQLADVHSGIQDHYTPLQTAIAAGTGAAIPLATEGAGLALKGVARGVRGGTRAALNIADKLDFSSRARPADGSMAEAMTGGLPEGPTVRTPPGPARPATAPKGVSDELWARHVTQESHGNQDAISPKGAFGRAQLMPGTAADMARELGDPNLAERAKTDPRVNEMLGRHYLEKQMAAFGDPRMGSAAYNAGPGAVRRAVGLARKTGKDWLSFLPQETQHYVASIYGHGPMGREAPDFTGPTETASDGSYTPQESTWTPEREAQFQRERGTGAAPTTPVAPAAPTRATATYLHPDGFPATEPPASIPGDFIVRAEPDGTHTVINKAAGWSPVASGLDRDAALAQAASLERGGAQPPATAHDATIAEIADSLKAGQGNATLLANHDVVGFEAALAAHGWQRGKKGEWSLPNGDNLFIRSQGDTARPIVQWNAADRSAAAPTPEEAAWLPEPSTAPASEGTGITDQALNVIRSGGRVKLDRGPSLGEFLANNGGLGPTPELRGMDAELWHRSRPFQSKLIRDGGASLEAAAQHAQEAGYFSDIAPPSMAGSDNMHPVTGEMLLEALRREFAGNPRYAREPDHASQDLAAHVDEVEQMLHELGLDPAKMSNAEIKAAFDHHFSAPDAQSVREPVASEPVRLANGTADQNLIPGVGRPTTADHLRAEAARRGRRGRAEGLPAGSLWDESAHGPDLLSGRENGRPSVAHPTATDAVGGVSREINGKSVRFPDAAHASLYDFGERLKRGKSGAAGEAQADKLRNSIGRFMDWSEDLAREPGLAAKFEGVDHSIPPRKLIFRAARDYAAHIDREPTSAGISLYDPERTADLVREGDGVKLGMRSGRSGDRRATLGEIWRRRRAQAQRGSEPADFSHRGVSAEPLDFAHRAVAADKHAAIDLSSYGEAVGASTGARGSLKPGAIPSGAVVGRAAYAGKRLAQIADDLSRSMSGSPVRQGRLTLRGAAGEFDSKSGVIRTNAAQEIEVRAHELTHALEFTMKPPSLLAALRKHAAELKPLAYPGAAEKDKRVEGFAEFGRWYIANPDYARKLAPHFYDAFEQALAKDEPAILAKWKAIQAEYKAYLSAPSTGVVAANVIRQPKDKLWGSKKLRRYFENAKREGMPSTVQMIADEVWEERVDKFHMLNVAIREARNIAGENLRRATTDKDRAAAALSMEKLTSLKTVENPYRLGRMVSGAYSTGHMDIRHGVHPYQSIDPVGPSIPDTIKAAIGKWNEEAYDDFGAYLISRRMLHQWERFEKGSGEFKGPPDMLSRETHAQAIKDFEAAYPGFKKGADLAYEYNRQLWKKRLDAGLISQETHDAGNAEHPDYVPAQRDVSDKPFGGARQTAGSGKFAGGAKQLKGSFRSFIHPIQSMMRETYELNVLTARNDVLKALDDLAKVAGPGGGAIAERIPATKLRPISIDAVESVKAVAKSAGLSWRDTQSLLQTIEAELDDQLGGTIFRSEAMAEKGEPIVYAWRDGKKIALRLPDGEFGARMFSALSGMTPPMRSLMLDTFAMGARIQRAGITTHPAFLFANYLRDQISAFALTDVGYKPFLSGFKGLADEVAGTKTARRYNTLGGLMGGIETSSLGEVRPELNAKRLMLDPRHPKQLASLHQLIRATELSETGTRLGVFSNAFAKAKRAGLDDYAAGKEAIWTARDYFDTDLHGSRMLVMRRVVPFLNAGIQGIAKAGRVATGEGDLWKMLAPIGRNAPKNEAERRALYQAYKLLGVVSALGVWGYVQSHLYDGDPEYQAFDVQERATNWFFKDEHGQWWRYPKPFELAAGSNIAEGVYESTVGHDPKALGRMMQGLYQILIPPFSIPWVTGAWEAARNKDYAGRPIVPEHLKGTVDPEMQYNSYTSSLGKNLGHVLHASPALVDHWINTIFGSWGQEVTGSDRLHNGAALAPEDTPVLRRFTSAPERGSLDATEFYRQVAKDGGKLSQAVGTFRMLLKDPAQDAKAIAYLNSLDPEARTYVISQVFTYKGSGALHPLTRAQNAVGVLSDIRTDMREGRLTDVYGQSVQLTPQERQQADKALARMGWEEMRNALVTTGTPGWAQKKPVPTAPEIAKLAAINPALVRVLGVRMAEQKVLPDQVAERVWNKARQVWDRPMSDAQVGNFLAAKRLSSSDPTAKREEETRIARSRGMVPNALARRPALAH